MTTATLPVSFASTSLINKGFWKLRQTDPELWWKIQFKANQNRHCEALDRLCEKLGEFVRLFKRLPMLREFARFAQSDHRTIKKAVKDLRFQVYFDRACRYLASVGSQLSKCVLRVLVLSSRGSNTHRSISNRLPTVDKRRGPPPLEDTDKLRDLVEKSKNRPKESPWDALQRVLNIKRSPPNTS